MLADFRYTNVSEETRIKSKIHSLPRLPRTRNIQVDVDYVPARPLMISNVKTKKLCKVIEEIGVSIGLPVNWVSTEGGSYGNFSAALGVPTIDGCVPKGVGASYGCRISLSC